MADIENIRSQIGLLPYLPFVRELIEGDPDLGIIIIEVVYPLPRVLPAVNPPARYSRFAIE